MKESQSQWMGRQVCYIRKRERDKITFAAAFSDILTTRAHADRLTDRCDGLLPWAIGGPENRSLGEYDRQSQYPFCQYEVRVK